MIQRESFDAVVIGGGVIGTSTLFNLVRLGCRRAAHRLPAFAEGRLAHVWSGLYDTTPDWNPVLGPAPGRPGLHLAFGFSGHGFKLSPTVGRMLAQSMLGRAPDLPLHSYWLSRFAEGDLLTGAYGSGAVS